MKTRRALAAAAVAPLAASLVALVAPAALAAPRAWQTAAEKQRDAARDDVKTAVREGGYTFCTAPRRPLGVRQANLCGLATEVDGCEALTKACDTSATDEPRSKGSGSVPRVLGPIAQVLVWLLVFGIAIALMIPIVRALAKARRDKQLADLPRAKTSRAVPIAPAPPDPAEITDAEAALREADALARRGELDRALGLYLAASLSALDRRGAIRLARHRTNGEYVRFCTDAEAKQPLREIVREVDRADYGKIAPTQESVAGVAARAARLVRAVAVAALVVAALAGCNDAARAVRGGGRDDPAGDALPMEVLSRGGFRVARLGSSLATMPMPDERGPVPLVVVDVEQVPLEEEAQAHLLRWVEHGGLLVLFGAPRAWPEELGAKSGSAGTRDLSVDTEDGPLAGARVATAQSLSWPGADGVATLGDHTYAARKSIGRGNVLGVANDDLFTNLGVARPANAAALVALIQAAAFVNDPSRAGRPLAIAVARPEDGVPPPSNPFAALLRAGLAKGAWHALAAAIVLFFAYGIRRARPRPAATPARRAFAEHVEATGAFYGRARAVGHALAAYGRFVDLRLRERLPRGADPAAFLAARSGAPLEHAKKVYERAIAAKPDEPPRGDELATIRELRAMLAKALETG